MTMSIDALYQDLLADLGDSEDTELYPWDSPSVAAAKVTRGTFLKKFRDNANTDAANAAALDTFLAVNRQCGEWQLKTESLLDEFLVGQFRYWTYRFFDGKASQPLVHSFDHVLRRGRNGPGASIGSPVKSFYTKLFDSRLTATSAGLHRAYTNYISKFPLWAEAEEKRRTLRGMPSVVVGNRLSFAPKYAYISRTTFSEPVLNMFCQLGVGAILEDQLKDFFGIDLAKQPEINRFLARISSLRDDMVTIDLKSASDSMANLMIHWALPQSFTLWLDLLRSPVSHVKGYGDINLNMVSTMGNGFTFPLQTALFSCVVAAAFDIDSMDRVDNPRTKNVFEQREPNWGVFGDDIVVPKRVASKVLRLLAILGFTVNSDKSFFEGHFRESCGFDAWKGVNVRGIYIKTLKTTQDRYTAINHVLEWSHRTGIPLPRTCGRLLRSVPKLLVPAWENVNVGVRLPYDVARLYTDVKRSKLGSYLYKRWVPKPERLRIDTDGEVIRTPRRYKPVGFNPMGLYLTFLAGHLENCEIRVKPNLVQFSLRTGVAPSWDQHPTAPSPYIGSGGGVGKKFPTLLRTVGSWV